MASYAQGTTVPVEKSQSEILAMLKKIGITRKAMGQEDNVSSVGFEYAGISYRISIEIPDRSERQFQRDGRNVQRTAEGVTKAWEAEERRRWRALVLVMKAKFVAIEDKVATFEKEFLAYAVTDNGQTLGERIIPAMQSGAPLALPGGRS